MGHLFLGYTHSMNKRNKRRIFQIIGLAIFAISLLGFAAFMRYVQEYSPATESALTFVEGKTEDHIIQSMIYEPPTPTTTGFIFYPGGKVDALAYAPVAQGIADQGYFVVVPRMPLNLAVFDMNRAADIIEAHPEITEWAIGGHSLGGAMAAQYMSQPRETISGLILYASYPADTIDLSQRTDIDVLSLYGTEDGLATPQKVDETTGLLPNSAEIIPIVGGNHAQFGDYGTQGGDGTATISMTEQHQIIISKTADFLKDLSQ